VQRFKAAVAARFSLVLDKADDTVIDENLRGGVELRGTNFWILIFAILIFAIFIAPIGLNVNSAAVIIGAMLISPLMGRSWALVMAWASTTPP